MYDYGTLIGGRWREGTGGAFETRNPAPPATIVGRYTTPSPDQVDDLMRVASAAQAAWRRVPGIERGALFNRFLDALATRTDELARAITLEQGKPLVEGRNEVREHRRGMRNRHPSASRCSKTSSRASPRAQARTGSAME